MGENIGSFALFRRSARSFASSPAERFLPVWNSKEKLYQIKDKTKQINRNDGTNARLQHGKEEEARKEQLNHPMKQKTSILSPKCFDLLAFISNSLIPTPQNERKAFSLILRFP